MQVLTAVNWVNAIVGPSKPSHWDAVTASVAVPWTVSLAQAVEDAFAN